MNGIGFEIKLPLSQKFAEGYTLEFRSDTDDLPPITAGLYYLKAENGVGKTSFLNRLALLSGEIGRSRFQNALSRFLPPRFLSSIVKGSSKPEDQNYIKYARDASRRLYPYTGKSRFKNENKASYEEILYFSGAFNAYVAARIREKDFTIVPQDIFFIPGLDTGTSYQFLNGAANNSCLDKEEFDKFAQENPAALSGGEKQWAFLLLALNKNKPVWFLDEPLNNLDSKRQIKFWDSIEEHHTGRIILIADHGTTNDTETNPRLFKRHCAIHALMRKKGVEKRNDQIDLLKIVDIPAFVRYKKTLLQSDNKQVHIAN